MDNKSIESITKKIGKALAVPQEIKPLRKKLKRAKPLKYDTGEKVWDKQIDDIITGNMDTIENKKVK